MVSGSRVCTFYRRSPILFTFHDFFPPSHSRLWKNVLMVGINFLRLISLSDSSSVPNFLFSLGTTFLSLLPERIQRSLSFFFRTFVLVLSFCFRQHVLPSSFFSSSSSPPLWKKRMNAENKEWRSKLMMMRAHIFQGGQRNEAEQRSDIKED